MFQRLTKLYEPVRGVQFGVIYKCLFIPNYTRKIMWLLINDTHEKIWVKQRKGTHITQSGKKLRHHLYHPGRALDLKANDLIGNLWVSLIIDQSECLVCFLFLDWIYSFLQILHCFKKSCTALNQSEWRNFTLQYLTANYTLKWFHFRLKLTSVLKNISFPTKAWPLF